MSDESAAKVRNMLSKEACQSMIQGLWRLREANGLTASADVDVNIQKQLAVLDSWYPDEFR